LAQFRSIQTNQGVIISGGSIIANSVTANQIKAGTITADRLSFPAFNKSSDTLDSITDGVTYKKATSTQLDGANRAVTYIGSDGKYQTVLQSTSYTQPSASGLYMNAQHLGFYNASTGGWTVDITSGGTMFLGSQYNNQYLSWDGNTLTVKGNVTASSVSAGISINSPLITGGTLKTASSGERIEITTNNRINFYDSYNAQIGVIYAPTGTGIYIQSYLGIVLNSSSSNTTIQSGGNINLIPGSGYYVTIQQPLYMSSNQPIYFGGLGSGLYGNGGYLTLTTGIGIQGSLTTSYGISSGGTITIATGYGILFGTKSLYMSGNNLMLGNTLVATWT
jgi:hypothetical protein